jgi:flagellar P-ring protein precursor FlgI
MKYKLVLAVAMLVFSLPSQAERIKDIANVQGVRSNQLIGYGLVVGLPGTGEKNQLYRADLYDYAQKLWD